MSISRQAFQGATWQLLSVLLQGVANIAILAVLARLVGPTEFGEIASVQIFVGILVLLADAGAAHALIQRATITREHIQTAFTINMLVSVGLLAILWGAAPLFARFFHAGTLIPVLRVVGATVLFNVIGGVSLALMQRRLEFRRQMLVTFVAYLVGYGGVAITLAARGWGVWALALGTVARSFLENVLLFAAEPYRMRIRLRGPEAAELMHFGGGFTLSRLLEYIAWQGDGLVVGHFLGLSALGIYQRAYELMELPGRFLGKIMEKVAFSSMARVREDRARLARGYLTGIGLTALLAAPLAAVMSVLAPEIVRVVYGPGWDAMVAPFRILTLIIVVRTWYRLTESLLRAEGLVYRNALLKGICAILIIGGSLIGKGLGLPGVAAWVAAATTLGFIMMAVIARGAAPVAARDWLLVGARVLGLGSLAFAVAIPAVRLCVATGLGSLSRLIVVGGAVLVAVGSVLMLAPGVRGSYGDWFIVNLTGTVRAALRRPSRPTTA